MYKTYKVLLIDSSFVIALLVVVAAFITAKTYTQLAVAIVLYPLLAFFAYKVFTHSYWKRPAKNLQIAIQTQVKPVEKAANIEGKNIGIADIDKRTFLKVIGGVGISLFLLSIFNKRIRSMLPQSLPGSQSSKIDPDQSQNQLTDGYRISEIDNSVISFSGFINKDGGWFIMRIDTNTGSVRYARGDSNFPDNWSDREKLKYDYFSNTF